MPEGRAILLCYKLISYTVRFTLRVHDIIKRQFITSEFAVSLFN